MSAHLKGKEVSTPRLNSTLAATGFWLAVATKCYGAKPESRVLLEPHLQEGVRAARAIPEADRDGVFEATRRSPVVWVARHMARALVNHVIRNHPSSFPVDLGELSSGLPRIRQKDFAAALETIRREAGKSGPGPARVNTLAPLVALQ